MTLLEHDAIKKIKETKRIPIPTFDDNSEFRRIP